MKKIRVILAILLSLALLFGITACSGSDDSSNSNSSDNENKTESIAETTVNYRPEETLVPNTGTGTKTLVAYFSATGNTEGIAERIADLLSADLYEISAAEPYSDDDIDYQNENSRAYKEQHDANARPELGGDDLNLNDYAIIYLGYPIWFGSAPRIMSTFVEQYDLNGKVIFPFCTSGSSGIGNSAKDLEAVAGKGNWMGGMRFEADADDAQIQSWVNGSNL